MKLIKYLLAGALCAAAVDMAAREATFADFSYRGEDPHYAPEYLDGEGAFFNPVISGWASDPSVVRVGDDYWLVTSTFGFFPGVPLYHSTDLANWEHVGNILSRKSQLPWLEGLSLGKGGIYAASINYDARHKKYYMVTTCVTPEGSINFYVTADDPMGEWSDPVVLEKVDGIDPSFFFDDDGRAYIVHKADEHSPVKWSNYRALAIIEFDPATGQTVGEPVKFREQGVGPEEKLERNEGAHIYKVDGKYYLLAAEGGTGTLHSEVCYKADSVMGPYQRWSRGPMLTQRTLKPNRTNPTTCTGHADLVTTPEGDWYAVFLGCRPWRNDTEQLGRETFLMPVKWSADGFPYITQTLDTIPRVMYREGVKSATVQTGNATLRYDFKTAAPDHTWLSLWGPADEFMHTTADGLAVELAPVDTHSGKTPAFIGRRIQNHDFTLTTTVTLDKDARAGDAAGLLIVKNEKRQLFLAVTPSGVELMRPSGAVDARADAKTLGRPVELMAKCSDGKYQFYYSLTPGIDKWQPIGEAVDASIVSSSQGGFTGTVAGIYATSAKF